MDTKLAEILRQIRRAKGITQTELARTIQCSQSAISMFEAGRNDALAEPTVKRIAAELGVDLDNLPTISTELPTRRIVHKYCPTGDCPANIPYVADGRKRLMPRFVEAPADAPTHCRFCWEVLQSTCRNETCGEPTRMDFANCPACGTPYVEPRPVNHDAQEWVLCQQRQTSDFLRLINEPVGGTGTE